jgi:carboxyl-terminal processing protease
MIRRMSSFILAALVLTAAVFLPSLHAADTGPIKPGDTIGTTQPDTPLKSGDTTLLTLPKGTGLTAEEINGDWVRVTVNQDGKKTTGWVHATHVARAPTWGSADGRSRQIGSAVSALLPMKHLSRHPLDDEILRRGLQLFLKTLDPMKEFFYQSDVDKSVLRGNWRGGDMTLAHDIFSAFLERLDERVTLTNELLAAPIDFTLDEQTITDPGEARYPQTADDARARWRKRIKYDLLMLKAAGIEGQQAKERLSNRYHRFDARMRNTGGEQLLEMYLTSLASAFDPHTTYMSAATCEDFRIAMKSQLDGIGAALEKEGRHIVVTSIVPGGSADKQGELKVGDTVVGVGQGTDGELIDTVDMSLQEVVNLIRSKRGTDVRLQVFPANAAKPKVIRITRAPIELNDQQARADIVDVGRKTDNHPYRIGVIELPAFYLDQIAALRGARDFPSASRDVRRILEDFNMRSVDAVILDLRHNNGGSLSEALTIAGFLLDEGPIVQVKYSDGQVKHFDDFEKGLVWGKPVVVLTGRQTGSTSEVVAGAIQDYRRGLIVGDRATRGKGTIQTLYDVLECIAGGNEPFSFDKPHPYGVLKITSAQWYRPSGEGIQSRGVLADVVLPSLTAIVGSREADLDFALPFDRVESLSFPKANAVSKEMCDRLQALSDARRNTSLDWRELHDRVLRFKKLKEQKHVTLNEARFLQERVEGSAEMREKKEAETVRSSERSTAQRGYYLDEVLAITLDYVQVLDQTRVD